MMKFRASLLIVMTALAHASASQATTWHSRFDCFVKLHYTKMAYGKAVSQVIAHIGIEQLKGASWMGASSETEWADVQDVALKPQDQAFLAQAVLKGESGKIGPYFKNFVVQYWVRFEDGSGMISEVFPIPVSSRRSTSSWQEYEKARSSIVEAAAAQAFWEGTSCVQVEMVSLG
jgi:hypothetical protein